MNNPTPQPNFKIQAKTALIQRGMNVTQLAKAISKARNSVSIAINHNSMLPGVKKQISKFLKLSA